MAVEFIDVGNEPQLEKGHGKKVLSNSRSFHTWIHGDYAGDKGTMHKHSADQTFYCIEGECTFHFPDAASRRLTPGMLVHIEAGNFYQLENTGTGPMVMMGTRTGPREANTHINFDTKTHLRHAKRPRGEKVDYGAVKTARVGD